MFIFGDRKLVPNRRGQILDRRRSKSAAKISYNFSELGRMQQQQTSPTHYAIAAVKCCQSHALFVAGAKRYVQAKLIVGLHVAVQPAELGWSPI
jgi:hypothetical protein